MAKYLVIVESPAKVKTIKNFWGRIMKSSRQRTCAGSAEKSDGNRRGA